MTITKEKIIPYIEAWKAARAERERTHPDDPDGGTFRWEGDEFTVFSTRSPTAHLEDYVLKPVQQYWLREEIPVADELLSYVPKLVEEFLERHPTFTDPTSLPDENLVPYNFSVSANEALVKEDSVKNLANIDSNRTMGSKLSNNFRTGDYLIQSKPNTWLVDNLKYTNKIGASDDFYKHDFVRERYPTACKLVERFGDNCPIATYSVINANSIIKRHTGIENRLGEYLRIHVPLIIPEGDIFFECEGYEIDWTDIWAFDNQLIHSAHNYTIHKRLIFLIDIKRSYLGLPNGTPYDGIRINKVPKFVRGALPKVLHKHQR